MKRAAVEIRRNPVLGLPAAERLAGLPADARLALRAVLIDLSVDASERAEKSWARRKAPMATYWRACSTYARHIARAVGRTGAA